jgi:hypothetical protein
MGFSVVRAFLCAGKSESGAADPADSIPRSGARTVDVTQRGDPRQPAGRHASAKTRHRGGFSLTGDSRRRPCTGPVQPFQGCLRLQGCLNPGAALTLCPRLLLSEAFGLMDARRGAVDTQGRRHAELILDASGIGNRGSRRAHRQFIWGRRGCGHRGFRGSGNWLRGERSSPLALRQRHSKARSGYPRGSRSA